MLAQPPVLISVFHSQFSLSARADDYPLEPSYFWVNGNFALELRAPTPNDYLPGITVPTPGETGSVRLHLHLNGETPDLQAGVYAVLFPFRVEENALGANVFCSCMEDAGSFRIPVGDWDVAAIFTRGVGDAANEKVGLRHFEVALHFLPRGTCEMFGEHYDRSWDTDFERQNGN